MKCKKQSLNGPLYKHLGHFTQDKYVEKGHNESGRVQAKKIGSVNFMNFEDGMDVNKNYEDAQAIKDRINMRKGVSIESGRPESMIPTPRAKKREGYRK